MPIVGPTLPPHLADKRKRDDSDEGGSDGKKNEDEVQCHDSSAKRTRVIGPVLPPAPLDERPTSDADEPKNHKDGGDSDSDSDSDDDDFGPALPTAAETRKASLGPRLPAAESKVQQEPQQASKRDEWMTLAPTSSDWSARIDPTKLKSRKFATGKKSTAPSAASAASGAAMWHETPEQKQARLQRELMGDKDDDDDNYNIHLHGQESRTKEALSKAREEEDEATRMRIREYNKSRGPSLYEAHQQQKKERKQQKQESGKKPRPGDDDGKEEEDDDDPSARPFDREKDIAGGMQINSTRRRELMQQASSSFASRFSPAKYL